MVQWIYENVDTDTSSAMEAAATNGHLDVLRWLHQRKCCSDTCTTSTMDGAVDGGHFLIANWLLENCSKGCSHNAPICATKKGNLKMLQWLHAHFNQKFSEDVMDKAARNGHLDVVKWLHEYRTEGCSTDAMDTAAIFGYLDVVQWLHDNRDEGCTRKAMDEAAANGYLDVLKWLHSNRSEGCTRTFGVCDGIIELPIRYGHYAVVRWLLEHNLDTYRGALIKDVIWGGHSELVCYLGENFKQYAYDWQNWGASEYELIEAAKQGYLKAVFVLACSLYKKDNYIPPGEGLYECIRNIFRQLSEQRAHSASPLWREVSDLMENFHTSEFYFCSLSILEQAFEQGFLLMVHQFFKRKTMETRRKYILIAAEGRCIMVIRWLVENGTPLDINSATILVSNGPYAEIAWWLSEEDRVTLVCEALHEKWYKKWYYVVEWILENTIFKEESSRHAIRSTIDEVSDESVDTFEDSSSAQLAAVVQQVLRIF
ncbi:hypothetical protein PHMEG_00037303 [Phytophthora megakarya]|uniref:Uncharacterized protein n=1 Tax=Phytophthora megakarya TaxID=4795 RepID=A0A225ULB9_9STRA|nr:hypothetical protein PHMEG_00037303 [Phytophthora megakarya]